MLHGLADIWFATSRPLAGQAPQCLVRKLQEMNPDGNLNHRRLVKHRDVIKIPGLSHSSYGSQSVIRWPHQAVSPTKFVSRIHAGELGYDTTTSS